MARTNGPNVRIAQPVREIFLNRSKKYLGTICIPQCKVTLMPYREVGVHSMVAGDIICQALLAIGIELDPVSPIMFCRVKQLINAVVHLLKRFILFT